MPTENNCTGIKGLALVLKYALEYKFYLEFNDLEQDKEKKAPLIGLAARIQQNFQNKMKEMMDLKGLVNTAKYAKRELLENMM